MIVPEKTLETGPLVGKHTLGLGLIPLPCGVFLGAVDEREAHCLALAVSPAGWVGV